MNFKEIPIGSLIERRVKELGIEVPRICNFMKCREEDLEDLYLDGDISVQALLRWSKLLQYDFFRLYSQHLILYSPPGCIGIQNTNSEKNGSLPRFRKHLYTREVIDFVLEQIDEGRKTKQQVIDDYRIPKTTLYKWIDKYRTPHNEK